MYFKPKRANIPHHIRQKKTSYQTKRHHIRQKKGYAKSLDISSENFILHPIIPFLRLQSETYDKVSFLRTRVGSHLCKNRDTEGLSNLDILGSLQ